MQDPLFTADDYGQATVWRAQVQTGVRAMLQLAGEDPDSPGLQATPRRVVDAWVQMTDRPGDPEVLLATVFTDETIDQMITVGPIPFASVCEHHLLPFTGVAWIAYIPTGSVVGLSKLPRLLEHYARRPQIQERLTAQVTTALDKYVSTMGSACCIRAVHSCATLRGVRKQAPMTTTSVTGAFKTDLAAREEFLATTRI